MNRFNFRTDLNIEKRTIDALRPPLRELNQPEVTDTNELYKNLLARESSEGPFRDYLKSQPDVNYKMRSILVDWLVTIHLKYKLTPEALYLSVNLVDRYLSKRHIPRGTLQLLGVSSLLIASKCEEIYPPSIKDFTRITGNSYTKQQVILMEIEILKVLDYNLFFPLLFNFLENYSEIAQLDKRVKCIARYFSELALVEYYMLRYKPSVVAAACVYVAVNVTGNLEKWEALWGVVGSEENVVICAKDLAVLGRAAPRHPLAGVREKYARTEHCGVALLSCYLNNEKV